MADPPLIALEDAAFGYRGEAVLRAVNLHVDSGDFIGLVGPNGSGKTTLFRGILGLIPPLHGRITRHPVLTHRTGYVLQRDVLDPIYPVTAHDVVHMGLTGSLPWHRTLGTGRDPVLAQSLARVGLEGIAGQPFSELSGGQRQRVLIARAIVSRPALLVLDEPTAGIDPAAEEKILELLSDLNTREGMAILMVSHRLHALESHARKAFLVRRGSVETSSPAEAIERMRAEQVSL